MNRDCLRAIYLFLMLLLAANRVRAASDAEVAIRQALDVQVQAWNRGDIDAFVATYSERCSFVGKQLVTGREAVLERYRRTYPTQARMGHLRFELLEVREVERNRVAYAVGKFHLDRASEAGGNADGIFSLVFEHDKGQWLIVLDHTS